MQRPRADQLLDKVLKGLEGSSRLYALVLPADHVILSPAGLFTLTLKSQDGQITCRGDTWRRRWSLTSMFRSLFGARLGNPTRQARKDAAALKKWLSSRLPDVEVPIQPVIVFAHPRADLKLEEPSVPVVRLDELKSYLREATRSSVLDRATLQSLTELFDQQAG